MKKDGGHFLSICLFPVTLKALVVYSAYQVIRNVSLGGLINLLSSVLFTIQLHYYSISPDPQLLRFYSNVTVTFYFKVLNLSSLHLKITPMDPEPQSLSSCSGILLWALCLSGLSQIKNFTSMGTVNFFECELL